MTFAYITSSTYLGLDFASAAMETVQPLRFQVAPGCAPNTMSRFIPAAPESASNHPANNEQFSFEVKLLPGSENTPSKRAAKEKLMAELLQSYISAFKEYMTPSFTLTMWHQKFGSLDRKMVRGGYSSSQIQQAYDEIEAVCSKFASGLSRQVIAGFQEGQPWRNAVLLYNAGRVWEAKCRDFPSWVYWLSNAALAGSNQTILSRMASFFEHEIYSKLRVQEELGVFIASSILEGSTRSEAIDKQRLDLIKRFTRKNTASYTPWVNAESIKPLVREKLYKLSNKFHGYTGIDFSRPVPDVEAFLADTIDLLYARQTWLTKSSMTGPVPESLCIDVQDVVSQVGAARTTYLHLAAGFPASELYKASQYREELHEFTTRLMQKIESPAKKLSSDLARGAFFIEQLGCLWNTMANNKELLDSLARNKELLKIVILVNMTMPGSVRSSQKFEVLANLKEQMAMDEGYLQVLSRYQLGVLCPRFKCEPDLEKAKKIARDILVRQVAMSKRISNKVLHTINRCTTVESQYPCQVVLLDGTMVPLSATTRPRLPACTGVQDQHTEEKSGYLNAWVAPACLFEITHGEKRGLFTGSQLFIIELLLAQRAMLWREIKAGLDDTTYIVADMYDMVRRGSAIWAPGSNSGEFNDNDLFALSEDWLR